MKNDLTLLSALEPLQKEVNFSACLLDKDKGLYYQYSALGKYLTFITSDETYGAIATASPATQPAINTISANINKLLPPNQNALRSLIEMLISLKASDTIQIESRELDIAKAACDVAVKSVDINIYPNDYEKSLQAVSDFLYELDSKVASLTEVTIENHLQHNPSSSRKEFILSMLTYIKEPPTLSMN